MYETFCSTEFTDYGTEENENATISAKLLHLAPSNYSDGVSGIGDGPDL